MYGEKVEEAEELRLDLQDVKDMYKMQIEDLLKKQNSTNNTQQHWQKLIKKLEKNIPAVFIILNS